MTADEVKGLLENGIEQASVEVQGEGDRFDIRVVSEAFAGMTTVRKQQMVYACINDRIADGSIHAVSIQTYTPDELAKAQRQGLI